MWKPTIKSNRRLISKVKSLFNKSFLDKKNILVMNNKIPGSIISLSHREWLKRGQDKVNTADSAFIYF